MLHKPQSKFVVPLERVHQTQIVASGVPVPQLGSICITPRRVTWEQCETPGDQHGSPCERDRRTVEQLEGSGSASPCLDLVADNSGCPNAPTLLRARSSTLQPLQRREAGWSLDGLAAPTQQRKDSETEQFGIPLRFTKRQLQMPGVSESVAANTQQVNHHTVTWKPRMRQMSTWMTTPQQGEPAVTSSDEVSPPSQLVKDTICAEINTDVSR